jgi:hypothetical protein
VITNGKVQHALSKARLNDVSKVFDAKNGAVCIKLE